jgi:hypothetical protein
VGGKLSPLVLCGLAIGTVRVGGNTERKPGVDYTQMRTVGAVAVAATQARGAGGEALACLESPMEEYLMVPVAIQLLEQMVDELPLPFSTGPCDAGSVY